MIHQLEELWEFYEKGDGRLAHKDANTQFCFNISNILGIKIENSSEIIFKGGVERVFRIVQNQIKGEMREKEITNYYDANIFLQEYMKQYNE